MLLLNGCVQPSLAPQINSATIRVLDALGISVAVEKGSGCCGALSYHLNATSEAQAFMRTNIDAWWPAIEQGAEAIVVTASGCAPMVKDYGRLLAADSAYADKARRVSELARDISEIITAEFRSSMPLQRRRRTAALRFIHPVPCSTPSASRARWRDILTRLGFTLNRGPQQSPLLRLGRQLLDPGARTCNRTARQQAGYLAGRPACYDRDRQYRLPDAHDCACRGTG